MRISVIIPTYNGMTYLPQTIGCLEMQNLPREPFEVVVVNDGSTDETGKWLSEYNGSLDLKIVNFSQNQGRSAARNAGADAATGDILLFLDGDMLLDKEFISNHLKRHTGDSNKVAVGKVIYPRKIPNIAYARYLERRGAFQFNAGDTIPGRYFLSGNSSLSRKLFNITGGFDTQFLVYGEDIDYGIRLQNSGAQFIYVPECVVTHLHIRSLNDILRTVQSYGKHSLPILIDKHPDLREELRLNWYEDSGTILILKKLILSWPVFRIVKFLCAALTNLNVPDILFKYLIFRSYFISYRLSEKQIINNGSHT